MCSIISWKKYIGNFGNIGKILGHLGNISIVLEYFQDMLKKYPILIDTNIDFFFNVKTKFEGVRQIFQCMGYFRGLSRKIFYPFLNHGKILKLFGNKSENLRDTSNKFVSKLLRHFFGFFIGICQ